MAFLNGEKLTVGTSAALSISKGILTITTAAFSYKALSVDVLKLP